MNDDHECNGICLWAADIGVPEAGDVVAYPHPDCPQHGWLPEPTREDLCVGCGEPYCAGRCADQGTLVVPDGLDFDRALSNLAPAWKSFIETVMSVPAALAEMSRNMNRMLWFFERECDCPTPTHRMSCGEGATPKVVVK